MDKQQVMGYVATAREWWDKQQQAKAERARYLAAQPGQEVREYKGAHEAQAGIATMARQGWRVSSQSSYQPRAGCLRILMLGGIGALVWKPKPRFVVTYTR